MLIYIIIKLLKAKNQRENLKSNQRKKHIIFKGETKDQQLASQNFQQKCWKPGENEMISLKSAVRK